MCSGQSCLFVQCWSRVFLVQCQGNLCNAVFAATSYYQKTNWSKMKIHAEVILLRRHWLGLFYVQCCLEPCGRHCKVFYLYNVVPRVLRQYWSEFFLEPLGQHCTRLLPVQCCPESIIRHHWTIFFPVDCYLEPQGQHRIGYLLLQCCLKRINTTLNRIFPVQSCLGQHCTRFLTVQCCPENIKATLNKVSFCALLSVVSRTTLHRVFSRAMLPQEC